MCRQRLSSFVQQLGLHWIRRAILHPLQCAFQQFLSPAIPLHRADPARIRIQLQHPIRQIQLPAIGFVRTVYRNASPKAVRAAA
jgi:hypothetical protein